MGAGVTQTILIVIFYLNSLANMGGAKPFDLASQWLTRNFDLICPLTLWLDKDAVILGSTTSENWQVIDHLQSNGRGRKLLGERHSCLIFGHHLTNIVITSDTETIGGQGDI